MEGKEEKPGVGLRNCTRMRCSDQDKALCLVFSLSFIVLSFMCNSFIYLCCLLVMGGEATTSFFIPYKLRAHLTLCIIKVGEMDQWVGEPAAKPRNLSLLSGVHRVKGENQLLKIIPIGTCACK